MTIFRFSRRSRELTQQTTAEKLSELGFSDAIYECLIIRTARVMHREIDADSELADRVFDTIRDDYDPYPIQERYDIFLEKWVRENAEALHAEQAKAFLTPFRAIASLF